MSESSWLRVFLLIFPVCSAVSLSVDDDGETQPFEDADGHGFGGRNIEHLLVMWKLTTSAFFVLSALFVVVLLLLPISKKRGSENLLKIFLAFGKQFAEVLPCIFPHALKNCGEECKKIIKKWKSDSTMGVELLKSDKTKNSVEAHAATPYANYLQCAKQVMEQNMDNALPEDSLKYYESISRIQTFDTFGLLFLARDVRTNELIALKRQYKSRNIERGRWCYVKESMKRLHALDNSFIVKTLSMFRDRGFLHQKLEYALYGDLERNYWDMHIREDSEKQMKYIVAQVVLALEYLKSCGVVHNDLRMANILLYENGYIKLTGFVYSQASDKPCKLHIPCNLHMAPEVIRRSESICAADWWSLGVLIYRMLLARIPFRESEEEKTFANIMSAKFDLSEYIEDKTLSQDGADIIKKLLVVNPDKRLGGTGRFAEQVRMHPWFKDIDFYALHHRLLTKEEILFLPDPVPLIGVPSKNSQSWSPRTA